MNAKGVYLAAGLLTIVLAKPLVAAIVWAFQYH